MIKQKQQPEKLIRLDLPEILERMEEYESVEFLKSMSIDKDTISFENVLIVLTRIGMIDINTNVQSIIL
jgi:hypothetical protein